MHVCNRNYILYKNKEDAEKFLGQIHLPTKHDLFGVESVRAS